MMATSKSQLSEVFRKLITREELQDLVKRSVSPNAELVDHHLTLYTDEKMGFLGSHLRLTVIFQRTGLQDEKESQSFFVKTLPFDEPSMVDYIRAKGCVIKESKFLEVLVPLMTRNFKGECWLPKCYLVKDDTMILEDLQPEGFSNKAKLLDVESVEIAIDCIARMHASSMLAEQRLGGKSLRDLYPEVFEESAFIREGCNYTAYKMGVNLAIDLANDMGLDSSQIRRASERIFDVCRVSTTKRNVVCHGDLWSNNMLFDRTNRHCRLVDFQMIRYLPPAHDLMLLLYWATSKDIRRKHEQRLLERYYRALVEILKTNDYNGEVPMSFRELLQAVEELRLSALVIAVINDPMTMMDGHTVARIVNDTVVRESFFFADRKFIVYDYMAAGNLEYEEKIKGLVRELVEMSLIIDTLPKYT